MADFYTNVSVLGNNILYRGVEDGKRVQYKHEYSPKIFVKSNKQTQWKTLFDDYVEVIEPGDIKETRDFIKKYSDIENFEIYGDINFDVQFISEKYSGLIDWSIDDVNVYILDIETCTENSGFPDPTLAQEEVLLISLTSLKTKTTDTWLSRKYNGKLLENATLHYCDDEYSLLKQFVDGWGRKEIDIISGWNVEGFDIKYLVTRINNILGEESVKMLSPWRKVSTRNTKDDYGKDTVLYDIVGISCIDYRDLYKKFTYTKRENYKLETICQIELGVGKLENPYDTFKEFYDNSWDTFVQYNIIDCERVVELEQKMKLLELCLTMSFLAKINFNDVFSQIKMWDAIIYNHLKSKNVVIPPRSKASKSDQFEGAYVKEPKPGFYNWVASFDATSLYPSIIQTWNISLETFIGMKDSVTVDSLLKEVNYDIGDYTLAANGAKYSKTKMGMMPELIDIYMKKRKDAKSLMLKYKSKSEELKSGSYSETEYKKLKNLISKYDNEQMAFKIAMNSLNYMAH